MITEMSFEFHAPHHPSVEHHNGRENTGSFEKSFFDRDHGSSSANHQNENGQRNALQCIKEITTHLNEVNSTNEATCAKILKELNAVEAGNETLHECCANIANDIKKLEASNQAFENTYASILAKLKYLDEKHSQPNSSAENNQLDKAKENYLRNIISKGIENKRNKPKSKVEIIVSFWTKYLKTLKDDGVNFVENLGSLPTQYAEQLIASINYDEEFFNSPKATIAKTYAALKSGVVDALDLATNPKKVPENLARLTEGVASAVLLHRVGMFSGTSKAGDLLTTTGGGNLAKTVRFTELASGASKAEVRTLLENSGLKLTPSQIQKVKDLLGGGRMDSITIKQMPTGEIRVATERAGRASGYQRMSFEISPEGKTTKVVQTAFDEDNTLVRQRPGQPKNNLYDVKKWKNKI